MDCSFIKFENLAEKFLDDNHMWISDEKMHGESGGGFIIILNTLDRFLSRVICEIFRLSMRRVLNVGR
jgi:hypothetical protein